MRLDTRLPGSPGYGLPPRRRDPLQWMAAGMVGSVAFLVTLLVLGSPEVALVVGLVVFLIAGGLG